MSKEAVCMCQGTLKEKMKYWKIHTYKGNNSAFNGYKFTPSDYSSISCERCKMYWRTKADYVISLREQQIQNTEQS